MGAQPVRGEVVAGTAVEVEAVGTAVEVEAVGTAVEVEAVGAVVEVEAVGTVVKVEAVDGMAALKAGTEENTQLFAVVAEGGADIVQLVGFVECPLIRSSPLGCA